MYKILDNTFNKFDEVVAFAWNTYKIELEAKEEYMQEKDKRAACIELERMVKSMEYKVTDDMLASFLKNGGSCSKTDDDDDECSCPLFNECSELFKNCNYSWQDYDSREGFHKVKKRMLERYIFRSLDKVLEEE